MSSVTANESKVGAVSGFRYGPELALFAVVLLWSVSHVVIKATYVQISPPAMIFARFSLITVLAFAVLCIRGKPGARSVRRADWPRFIAAGLAGYTVYQLCYALGLDLTSPFSSALLIALVPLISVVILAAKGEPTGAHAWIGLGVALIGVVIFLSGKRDGAGTLLGDLLSFGAAVSFAVYGIVSRPLVHRYPTETYAAYTTLAGAMPLLAVTLPGMAAQDWGSVTVEGWLALLYTVIFPVYVAYILWNWSISQRGVAAATSFQFLVPVTTGILSALVLHEAFGPLKLAGAAIILAGLMVVRTRSRADRPRRQPTEEPA